MRKQILAFIHSHNETIKCHHESSDISINVQHVLTAAINSSGGVERIVLLVQFRSFAIEMYFANVALVAIKS